MLALLSRTLHYEAKVKPTKYIIKRLKGKTYEPHITDSGKQCFSREEALSELQSIPRELRPMLQEITNDRCHHGVPMQENCGECHNENMLDAEGI